MKQYVVDAFTNRVFAGNPAAICVMDSWLPDSTMQQITSENNLSETAFLVKEPAGYHLRWFTPGGEIDLCGHATLASAFVIMNFYEPDLTHAAFSTMSGELFVERTGALYKMSFPSYQLVPTAVTDEMTAVFGVRPLEAYLGRDLLCVMENEQQVRTCSPDMEKMKHLDGLLQHITAAGQSYDCVSRSFAPKLNVPEDPVCGSGHCHIVPYWQKKLNKSDITAYQASSRGGTLYCSKDGDRTILSGEAVLYSIAEINTGSV